MAWGKPLNHGGNPNPATQEQRKARRKARKKVITWKDPSVGYGLTKREKPASWQDPGLFAPKFKEQLVLGAPMVTKVGLEPYKDVCYPFQPLRASYLPGDQAPVKAGSWLTYAGTVRVRERVRAARQTVDMEVPKHTFIVPGFGRCIIHDLNLVRHV